MAMYPQARSLQRAVTAHLSLNEHSGFCALASKERLSPSAYALKVLRAHMRGEIDTMAAERLREDAAP